jgi:GTP-binding protein
MTVPVVAIVGRPNVGKSSLFNWLAGKRIAIVDPTAGVTRDRVAALVKADHRFFELIDTGGIGIQDVDNLTAQVEAQIAAAMEQAAVILFVVDTRDGVVPLDEEVAQRLRAVSRPVLLLANKCDTPALEPQTAEFARLGFGMPLCVSAQQNRNKDELLRRITEHLPPDDGSTPNTDVAMKLAIVGRRNTGKSTFINCLAESERVIVSEVPGTTRDSIDVRFERDGQVFIAIDTAGVRRKQSVSGDIEFYSMARAQRSIRRADVVLHFLDARLKISKVDKTLAEYVLEQHKPVIFVVNKWDLAKGTLRTGQLGDYIHKTFPMLDFVPIAFIAAKDGKNVRLVVNLAQSLHKQACTRVGTGDLNRVLRQALTETAPPLRQNRRPKVFYGTQVSTNPPTIVLFTNGPELFSNTYQRYLIKSFRDHLPFNDIPIKLYLRAKQRDDATDIEADTPAPKPKRGRPATKKPPHSPAPKRRPAKEKSAPELWEDV